jgi:hypothetical protein
MQVVSSVERLIFDPLEKDDLSYALSSIKKSNIVGQWFSESVSYTHLTLPTKA